MEYLVYIHPTVYEEVIMRLSTKDQKRINNLIQQFTTNPYVGNSLQIRYLREKRFNGKRIYYIVFEDMRIVLIVAISNKRSQQKTIDSIIFNINKYRDYAKSIVGES